MSDSSQELSGSRQRLYIKGETFPVTAGADFTITCVARVGSQTTDAGYFTTIFLDNLGGIRREAIMLTPNERAVPGGAFAIADTVWLVNDLC